MEITGGVEKIGQGVFSMVYKALAVNKEGKHMPVALKKIFVQESDGSVDGNERRERYEKYALDEINILAYLAPHSAEHHVITFFGYSVELVPEGRFYWLMLDFCAGGDLFDYLATNEKLLSGRKARRMCQQAATALFFIHSNKIVHCDIKPSNFVLKATGALQLTDFGLALEAGHEGDPRGSHRYCAPEILNAFVLDAAVVYEPLIDMWSLGVVLFIILTKCHPFIDDMGADLGLSYRESVNNVMHNVNSTNPKFYTRRSQQWHDVGSGARDLVQRLLTIEPQQRPTAQAVLRHGWLWGGGEEE